MQIPHSTLPHGTEPVVLAGNITNPTRALLLMHGRGASAENIMQLTSELAIPNEYIVLAPQAANHTWYPERFTVSTPENQPDLDSALNRIQTMLSFLETTFGIHSNQIIIAGFSQGACLTAEYLKRYPAVYKGVAVFSGGLIGSDIEVGTASTGDLKQTPIYIGCDVEDFHIPKERVVVTAETLTKMEANVDLQLYEGLGHTIHTKGLAALQHFINF